MGKMDAFSCHIPNQLFSDLLNGFSVEHMVLGKILAVIIADGFGMASG